MSFVLARVVAVAAFAALVAGSTVAASGSQLRDGRTASGYSLALNGTSAYVSVPDSKSLQLERTNAFTVALRVRLDSYSNNVLPRFWEKGPQYLCIMGDPTNGRFREIGLEVQNASGAGNSNGGATEFWGSTKVATGRWYFIAVTFDASLKSNQAQIYVDGAPEKMATIYPWSGKLFATAGKPWMIGRRTNDLARQLDGRIDWMLVYPTALGAKQVAALSNGQSVPGAVADWGFDEGGGTVADDSSGHGNSGSIVNGVFVAN
ncbi:MAG TPA: LamG domain-containing protein [Gaiellaceae bacterium]|nr:LamG domain-containing protein [Gaiellaceae bacterium]